MSEKEHSTAEPLEEPQDHLEEEVGDVSDEYEPEEYEAEYGDEPEEDSQEQEESAGEQAGDKQPAQDEQRFTKVESQISQLANSVNQLAGLLSGQHQRQPQNDPVVTQPPDLEAMTQSEVAQFVMGQAVNYVKSQLQGQQQMFARQMGLQGELLNVLLENHPNGNAVRGALQEVLNNPGVKFSTALKSVVATSKEAEYEKLLKENEQLKKTSRGRAFNARKGSHRPRNAKGRKTKFASHADAFNAALDEAMM